MGLGAVLSGLMHAAAISLALFGLPWFAPREMDAIRVTEVSFISEAQFAAAQQAAASMGSRSHRRRRSRPPLTVLLRDHQRLTPDAKARIPAQQ